MRAFRYPHRFHFGSHNEKHSGWTMWRFRHITQYTSQSGKKVVYPLGRELRELSPRGVDCMGSADTADGEMDFASSTASCTTTGAPLLFSHGWPVISDIDLFYFYRHSSTHLILLDDLSRCRNKWIWGLPLPRITRMTLWCCYYWHDEQWSPENLGLVSASLFIPVQVNLPWWGRGECVESAACDGSGGEGWGWREAIITH